MVWLQRRAFIMRLGGAAAAWPLAARAQQAVPTLGVISIAGREATFNAIWYKAFWEGLLNRGWAPGRTLSIEYRFADHRPSLLPDLVKDLISRKPDAIFVPTRPALPAVKEATTTIPIVFVSLGDPIAEGWISSLARPEGNLTGIAGLENDWSYCAN